MPDVPVADVVAYVHGSIGYTWCGWCRQWRYHGTVSRLPEVRPSQCPSSHVNRSSGEWIGRNPYCPTRDDAPVMVWPVPVRTRMALVSGDGRLGGKLPISDIVSEKVETVVAACESPMQLPKALVKLVRAADGHMAVRVQSARFTWVAKTGRVADVHIARFDCECTEVLRICYVDNRFDSAESNKRGRLAGNKVRRAIIDCEADAT